MEIIKRNRELQALLKNISLIMQKFRIAKKKKGKKIPTDFLKTIKAIIIKR